MGPLGGEEVQQGCGREGFFACHPPAPPTPTASLPELANAGRPLFPGNDVDDQLKRIFRYSSISLHLKPSGRGSGAQSAGREGGGGLG